MGCMCPFVVVGLTTVGKLVGGAGPGLVGCEAAPCAVTVSLSEDRIGFLRCLAAWPRELEWGHRFAVGLMEGGARSPLSCLCSLGKKLRAGTGPLVSRPGSQELIG